MTRLRITPTVKGKGEERRGPANTNLGSPHLDQGKRNRTPIETPHQSVGRSASRKNTDHAANCLDIKEKKEGKRDSQPSSDAL